MNCSKEHGRPRRRIGVAHAAVMLPALLLAVPALAAAELAASTQSAESSISSLKNLSVDELLNVEVTSVSKTAEPLSDAASAIYVITRDEILRSGARSLPDMLRLAPNLEVAQISSSSFAISARGFNGPAASKLLVLIDGRSVYTPYHSGVSWDIEDVPAEDIERIEVISGPGATLWGANAVNGVINIITRNSADTQGASAQLGGGNLEQRANLQYGGSLGPGVSFRLYADSFRYDDDTTASGTNALDGWHKAQGGFRVDWSQPGDLLTMQGDLFGGTEEKLMPPEELTSGGNLLARWNHQLSDGSGLQIQTYYDHVAFSLPGVAKDDIDTYDLELQHNFSWGARQSIVWGAGVRSESDDFPTVLSSTQPLLFSPQRRTLNFQDAFIQDSISLSSTVKAILGTKLENDPYTGFVPLPSARLSWKVTNSNLLWAAVSRAVRAPSRLDRDLSEVEGSVVVVKGGDFQPEKLTAYELGYRTEPASTVSLSVSTFYNVYNDLRSLEPATNAGLPFEFANLMDGKTYGVEVSSNYQVFDWWLLTAGANWLHEDLHFDPGSSELGGIALAGDDPLYQASLRSTMNLAPNWLLYLDLRRVSALPNPASPAYTEADLRIAWTVSSRIELSLVGSNLLHAQHLEFGTTSTPIQLGPTGVETGRSVFFNIRCGL
ncbi:MAG TPA: TonB-dependent receptor [Steroidobacteraceae bacterium]|nr:TonB-dependent receptor [Steroidobacteraceae bacterium]